MISSTILQKMKSIVPQERILLEESMAGHTSFHIGGPADCYVTVQNVTELQRLVELCKENTIPFFLLGNGSNLLVSDSGFRGVIIKLGSQMSAITVDGNTVRAGAGALLSTVARTCMEHGLTGFEFASGIPGTLGGGVIMNAGAYGGEMSQVVEQVTVLTKEGQVLSYGRKDFGFGYRQSRMKTEQSIVLEVEMSFSLGDRDKIKETMMGLAAQRREKQPLEYPSAGSTFKRPEGYFAGKLIMDAGLRGYRVGDAQVSEKHCGFVINRGNATAEDVRKLMEHVTDCVEEQFKVHLEPEVIYLG